MNRGSTPVARFDSPIAADGVLVSVIIPTRNRAHWLSQAVSAVLEQDLEGQIQLIVVDDASEDETETVLHERLDRAVHPITYLRLEHRSGPAVARNAALEIARGRFIAFTDDDCIPSPGWLRAALEPFGIPLVGIVQGQTTGVTPSDSYLSRHVETHRLDGTFATANVVYRRQALDGHRFDPDCTWGQWEDMDLGWRVLESGWEARFAPGALVRHQIIPMEPVQWVRWPWHYYVWCANAARHPGVRRHLFLGVWIRPMHLCFDLAIVGLVASRWNKSALVLAIPYGVAFMSRHNVRPPGVVRKAALYLARDAVGFTCLIAGSIRHRTVVL